MLFVICFMPFASNIWHGEGVFVDGSCGALVANTGAPHIALPMAGDAPVQALGDVIHSLSTSNPHIPCAQYAICPPARSSSQTRVQYCAHRIAKPGDVMRALFLRRCEASTLCTHAVGLRCQVPELEADVPAARLARRPLQGR
jgi:hypothetical protein